MPKDTVSTRDQIVHMLKVEGALTVGEMANRLGITEMAVRRHLNTLERDNYITASLQRQAMGRPTHIYSLSREAEHFFPKDYQSVTLDLLRDIKDMDGEEKVAHLFQRREERMYGEYSRQIKGDTLEDRLDEIMEIQNEKGYMVDWFKDEQTGEYILSEYNCPIADVAAEFNIACQCELNLFRRLLPDTEVFRTECKTEEGDKCRYVIRPKFEK